MQKILITGGAGNVGSSLVKRLVASGNYAITVVDDLSTGNIVKLSNLEKGQIEFIKADVNNFNDISPIMVSRAFDYVFHYAAVVGVKRTLEHPINVLKDIEGIKNILDLSKNTGVKRVFFSSSSEVYGEPVEFPQNEDTTPLNSRLPYAVVKNVGESFFRSYYHEFGLNYTIFRFFNTYGPNQSDDFVVPRFLELAHQNKPITIYGDGSQSRTFCYVDDNTEAIQNILQQEAFVNDTVNIGSDKEMSVLELAKKIISFTNSSSEIAYLPALPEGDMTRRKPDISKMKSILNRDLTSLEMGLGLTYKEIKKKYS
jgi:UDP-glucose 4-epimerase